jgi:DnaJ-class molecular chaperone
MTLHREYYDILGVQPDASQEDIKKAFRAKAKECHPDHHPGDAAKERAFKLLSIAYGVLCDTDKRKHYDETGSGPAIDIMGEVYGLIVQTFQKIVQAGGDDVLYSDPLKRMKDLFTESKGQAEGHIQKMTACNERNDKLIKKITHRDVGKGSFLHMALEQEKRQNASNMEKARHAIEIMDRACEVLDEFTFKADKRKEDVFDHRRSPFGSWPTFSVVFDQEPKA